MPRTARIEVAGGIHHVTARGNRRQPLFHDTTDRRLFIRDLAEATRSYGWNALTYCLMTNHVHLVIETPEPTLGLGMRRLESRYAWRFNHRHETGGGHLFQGRFGSVIVASDAQFAQLLRYVALNPVKAGLSRDASSWRWSRHRALLAGDQRVETLLAPWGGDHGSRYRRLFDPEHVLASRYGSASPWEHRPPLGELLQGDDLDESMRRAHRHGYRLAEIAAEVGVHLSTVSRRIRRAS
jgi:putative transposase